MNLTRAFGIACRRIATGMFALTVAMQISEFPVEAQTSNALSSITGVVQDPTGEPIPSVLVAARGVTSSTTVTDKSGHFTISQLSPGLYEIIVTKASFDTATLTDITVLAGTPASVNVVLRPTSFSQLREIGRVTTSSTRSTINTSPASVNIVPGAVLQDQGQPQVTSVLNEIPGMTMTMNAFANTNGAAQNTQQVPQIRGALPYETESLIDGHPISVGANGYFTPLYLDPHFLQDIEVLKGPGVVGPDINYAVGGSINYRTLEPTAKPNASVFLDYDSYGGFSTTVTATGRASKLGYAFGYSVDGTPGPLNNFRQPGMVGILGQGNATVNGQPFCGTTAAGNGCYYTGFGAGNPTIYNDFVFQFPLQVCCGAINTDFVRRSELAKLQYNFSPETSLSVTYLSAQTLQNEQESNQFFNDQFIPPMGYAGSVPSGTVMPFGIDTYNPFWGQITQGLLQSEFRTAIGSSSLLFRYYTGANNQYEYVVPFGSTYQFTGNTWGGLPNAAGGTTFYNGQPTTFAVTDAGINFPTQDHFSGLSGEVDLPSGNDLYTLSIDRTVHSSYASAQYELSSAENYTTIPAGSSQAFTTILARGDFNLGRNIEAILGNYFINYSSHYSPDGGLTFQNSSHPFYGPRLGVTWRPDNDLVYRLGVGSSIAPPYLALITTQGGVPQGNNSGAINYFTFTKNNGNISPETSFGFDLGVDKRFSSSSTVVSADIYQTNLHGQFLNSVTADGTYTNTMGVTAPLFVTTAQNLGTSRYQGVEVAIHHDPSAGFGYRVQGSLQRAYVYNLPPGFYNTAAGPDTTNLAVIPNINFQPSGDGYNGMSNGRIPYSNGYAEVSYRTGWGNLYQLGETYFGPNNSYNHPAFGVMSGTMRFRLARHTSLQFTGYNLTGVYNTPYFNIFTGIPVALKNGLFGATSAINVGPTTLHVILRQDVGPGP